MKKLFVILLALAGFVIISCEKDRGNKNGIISYYTDDIEDIMKIKELLKDMDCDKGVAYKAERQSDYGHFFDNNILYCDDYPEIDTNVDKYYKELYDIKCVTYDQNNKKVTIEGQNSYQTYYRVNYYSVVWYWVYVTYTCTFYTKNNH